MHAPIPALIGGHVDRHLNGMFSAAEDDAAQQRHIAVVAAIRQRHMIEIRLKEIGIRKILGASVGSIVGMLSKDFLQLVLISLIVGFPIAWLAMDTWLQNFVYRIQISWWMYGAAGIIALLIALLTVSYQSIAAAVTNPVKSLKE